MFQLSHIRPALSVLALGALLASCSAKTAPNISIENGAFRMPAPGQTTGAAYFDIVNTGGADVLVSASTPVSDHVELHIHIHDNGVMRMRQVPSIDAKGNTTTPFKRGGKHVMVFNVNAPQGAMSIPMTLNFEHSGAISFDAKIGGGAPMNNHMKMDHGDKNTDMKSKEMDDHKHE